MLWSKLGRERSFLGFPKTDQITGGYATGAFSVFQGGSIYWSTATGTHWTKGSIRNKFLALGAEKSFLHYPTTHEVVTSGLTGRYQHFQGGSIFWKSGLGAHPVSGSIRSKWASMGWERSWLGYPTGDMYTVTLGRRQNFQHGYLVWKRSTGVVSAYRF